MENKKVLVLINNFNDAKFLPECVKAIRSQTYKNFDIYGMDAGSKDNSVEVFESLDIPIVDCTGLNQAATLNKSLKEIRAKNPGKYYALAWINPDDLYTPNSFEDHIKAFEKEPDTMIVYSYCIMKVYETGQEIQWKYKDFVKTMQAGNNPLVHPTTMIRLDLFDKIGYFDDSLKFPIDMELWFRTYVNGYKLKGIPVNTAVYCVRQDNLTHTRRPEILEEVDIIQKRFKIGKYRV